MRKYKLLYDGPDETRHFVVKKFRENISLDANARRHRNLPGCRGEESHGFRRSLHASSEDYPCWCKLTLATLWTLGLLLAVLVAPRGWSVYALAGMYIFLAVPAALLVPIGMRLMKFPFFPVPFAECK